MTPPAADTGPPRGVVLAGSEAEDPGTNVEDDGGPRAAGEHSSGVRLSLGHWLMTGVVESVGLVPLKPRLIEHIISGLN